MEETSVIIQDFRDRLGDTTKSIPESYLLSYINTAVRRLARTDGLDGMFGHHDTYELAAINKDGTPSAAWPLDVLGNIIDIQKLRLLVTNEGVVRQIKPKWMEPDDFFDKYALPEQRDAGNPVNYTIEQIGTYSKLIFDRPPCNLVVIDMKYTAFPKRITKASDLFPIPYAYHDSALEYIIILHKIETTDMSTGRALYEDLDVITTDIKELLAKRKGTLPLRRIVRSF